MHWESRRICLAGVTRHPNQEWMEQMARNVTMEDSGFLIHRKYLLHDRDSKYCSSFRQVIEAGSVKTLVLPARSPNLKRALKEELRRRKHLSVAELGKWLRSVVQGYFNYHAVPGNLASLRSFRLQVIRRWMRALRRRSQKSRMTWPRLVAIAERWLPQPSILHPYPNLRFDARHPR